MNPNLKRLLFCISACFYTLSAFGQYRIHVMYGDLKKGQMAILERVFKPRLSELARVDKRLEVKETAQANADNLIEALSDPQTLGVFLLGHPAIKTKGEGKEREIIHGYLMGSQGRYLPKNILSAAHEKLGFLSLLTCHESAIIPLYRKFLPKSVHYFESPTHHINSLSNPLFEFTSFYSTPKVLDKVLEKLVEQEFLISTQKGSEEVEEVELIINTRDQVSGRFDYTVELDNKVIGALQTQKNIRGRLLNQVEHRFKIPRSQWEKARVLRISPDDPFRPKPLGLSVVDDILLEKIVIKDQGHQLVLLNEPIHLGDQENEPDMGEGLGFLRNISLMENSPFSLTFEKELP